MNVRHLAIMQGRLLPPLPGRFQHFPRDGWEREFALAREAGLQAIECIYDSLGADVNPLATETGIELMNRLSGETGVLVRSICADVFMETPLVRTSAVELDERLGKLRWLLGRCARAGIERIVLPFVDASRVSNEAEMDEVARVLQRALPAAEEFSVELHLETSLGPADFTALLERVPHPMVLVNYDSGNSASLGYNPRDEFEAYGRRIGSVHIKDRILGGSTVPLGSGCADFDALLQGLRKVDYRGDMVLQVARGKAGDEVSWARGNVAHVRRWLGSA